MTSVPGAEGGGSPSLLSSRAAAVAWPDVEKRPGSEEVPQLHGAVLVTDQDPFGGAQEPVCQPKVVEVGKPLEQAPGQLPPRHPVPPEVKDRRKRRGRRPRRL